MPLWGQWWKSSTPLHTCCSHWFSIHPRNHWIWTEDRELIGNQWLQQRFGTAPQLPTPAVATGFRCIGGTSGFSKEDQESVGNQWLQQVWRGVEFVPGDFPQLSIPDSPFPAFASSHRRCIETIRRKVARNHCLKQVWRGMERCGGPIREQPSKKQVWRGME
eukprot:gene13751-biopygen9994